MTHIQLVKSIYINGVFHIAGAYSFSENFAQYLKNIGLGSDVMTELSSGIEDLK